jgi:hypothetical protein
MKRWARHTARATFAIAFVAAFLLCLGFVFAAFAEKVILWPDVEMLLTSLAEVYSLPLGALVGAVLAGDSSRRAIARTPFIIIMLLVLSWNAALMCAFATLPTKVELKPGQIANFCSLVSGRFSFLVVGALTYLTGKSAGGEP